MNKLIITLFLLVSSVAAGAQMRWGVEGGVNVSHAFDTEKTKAGFNIGAVGEYSFSSHWFMDASLKLSSQPCGIDVRGSSDDQKFWLKADYTPYYLTLLVRAGFKFYPADGVRLHIAVGPMIGVGLWGSGHYSSSALGETDADGNYVAGVDKKIKHFFSANQERCFSSSRFEYGANAKIGAEFAGHYRVNLEYSLIYIPGKTKSIDNMGVFSVNISYMF